MDRENEEKRYEGELSQWYDPLGREPTRMWGDPQFWTSLLCNVGIGGYQAILARKANRLQEQIMRGQGPVAKTIVVKRGYHWLVILALMAICWVPYLFSQIGKNDQFTLYLIGYGPMNPGFDLKTNPTLKVTTEGGLFRSYRNDYHLAGVAFRYYGYTQRNDVQNLEKSALFDITEGTIIIPIPLDQYFINTLGKEMGTNYALLLVPNKVQMGQFGTLRQAEALGVKVVQEAAGPP